MELDRSERTPANDFGALVGYEKSLPEPDLAILELALEHRHCNRLGTVHGGVIMAMLDAAGMWACTDSGQSGACATVSINVHFLKAVQVGKVGQLTVRGSVVRKTQRFFFANAVAMAGDEMVATAQGVYVRPSARNPANVA